MTAAAIQIMAVMMTTVVAQITAVGIMAAAILEATGVVTTETAAVMAAAKVVEVAINRNYVSS